MKYTFPYNGRMTRYDHVTLYRGYEIGVYSYHTKGILTWMAHINGQTNGYYDSLGEALEKAQQRIDSWLEASGG